MERKRCKGTPLKVFSGKEATLNRIILLLLCSEKLLTKYDIFLNIKNIKGFRHINSKTVYRRVDALEQERWITQNGKRHAKVYGDCILYELSLKGKAAIKLDEKNIETFLNNANIEQLIKFIDSID